MKGVKLIAAMAILVLAATGAQAGILDNVKKAGEIKVGVSGKVPGFSVPDQNGVWAGLDVRFRPGRGGGGLQRSQQGQIRAGHDQRALHGATDR